MFLPGMIPEKTREIVESMKTLLVEKGRSPSDIKFIAGIFIVVDETDVHEILPSEAEDPWIWTVLLAATRRDLELLRRLEAYGSRERVQGAFKSAPILAFLPPWPTYSWSKDWREGTSDGRFTCPTRTLAFLGITRFKLHPSTR